MQSPSTALIVGAGIGGLAAGLALRHAGWRVRLFERSPVPRSIGFGLGLAPNAMAALRELGVADAVLTHGFLPVKAEVRRPDGTVLRRLDVTRLEGSLANSTVIVLRPALHDVLIDALGRDHISFGSDVTGFTLADGRVTLRLTDGRAVDGDLLVGADGAGTIVRRVLFPDEPPPRRSGHWAIRGVAYDAGEALGELSAAAYLGDGIESMQVRASRSAIYWYVSLLAGDIPTDTRDPRTVVERLTTNFVASYQAIPRATKDEDMRLDELFDRDPINPWGRGPVTLLGDAAHPMLPHTGQGAAQALEDAVALGRVLSRPSSIEDALRKYEQVRSRRTGAIVRQGRRIASVTTTRNGAVRRLRDAVVQFIPEFVLIGAFVLIGRHDPHRKLRAAGLLRDDH
ncbi:MAG TPA: FAD-dependent monooxygenase [Vicinamibacterales bacterium]|nr:FAD-dependent monooxygenase [Vicinamibacterales bacterium]